MSNWAFQIITGVKNYKETKTLRNEKKNCKFTRRNRVSTEHAVNISWA